MSLSKSIIYRVAGLARTASPRLMMPSSHNRHLLEPTVAAALIQPSRQKGHSKWQNIAATKGANDIRLAKLGQKYAWMIGSAIRSNGGQTDMARNRDLERLFKAGLGEGILKTTLEKAIKNASVSGSDLTESIQEVRGPGNCFILVEMLSKSAGQAKMECNRVLNKKGGAMSKGVINIFERKGQIVARPPPDAVKDYNIDKAEEDAIEMGAEEVEVDDDGIVEFLCGPLDFPEVKAKAEEMKYEVLDASVRYVPNQWMELTTERERTAFDGLIAALDNNQFVTAVHHNVLPSEDDDSS